MIHIYMGNGKGKTTAALGLSLRAAGAGLSVMFLQFLKDSSSSELCALKSVCGITVKCYQECVKGFFYSLKDIEREKLRSETKEGLDFAHLCGKNKSCDMIVLDEIGGCIQNGIVGEEEIIDFLKKYGKDMEIILTGRQFPEKIISISDYVSEIGEIKHPYSQGVPSRKGIEY